MNFAQDLKDELSTEQLRESVQTMRAQRDTLWKSYLAAKENCRVLRYVRAGVSLKCPNDIIPVPRAYNKDLEDEVLAKGRMIVLALEVGTYLLMARACLLITKHA